jgi:protein TonB
LSCGSSTGWSGRLPVFVATVGVSALLHGGAFAAFQRLPPEAKAPPPMELDIEVVEPPPPPEPLPEPARPPPAPRTTSRSAPARQPLALARPAPPPPNEEPPTRTPKAPAVLRVGLSLSSTTVGGSFAVPAGNTLYGKAPERAVDPGEVKPYRADRYAAPTQLSVQPRLVDMPEIDYPSEARKAGVEGKVLLLLRIDEEGRVAEARVLSEPGNGLGKAARDGALRFRFSPALEEGRTVGTEIRFTYTFVLE